MHNTPCPADGLVWRKSLRSSPPRSWDENCVEAADCRVCGVHVRDSKDTAGPRLTFAPATWRAFLARIAR